MGKINWVASILIAIPIGIVANLLTPRIQKVLERRSEARARAAFENLKEERDKIRWYYQNRGDLYLYLLSALLKIALTRALLSIIGNLVLSPAVVMQVLSLTTDMMKSNTHQVLTSLAALINVSVWMIGLLIIFRIAKGALQTIYNVLGYESYMADINTRLANA